MALLIIGGATAVVVVCATAYFYLWGRKHNLKKVKELSKIKKHVHNHR